MLTSHCCWQNRLILGKITCCLVKEIQVARNKKVGVKVTPFLLPFPVSLSLYFQLLYPQVHCLAGGKVGLWSVHNCSSLLLLPLPIFPLLWRGIFTGFRGISSPVPGAAASPLLASPLPPCCSHLGIYILCIHKWWLICFIKPIRALPNGEKWFIQHILRTVITYQFK